MELGFKPIDLTVNLTSGAGFQSSLVATELWDEDSIIELRFTDETWTATIDQYTASWNVTAAEVAEVIGERLVELWYSLGATSFCWARGVVR